MSTAVHTPVHHGTRAPAWPLDYNRGTYGMYTVIATELSLFVCLFASYYYLEYGKDRWGMNEPPKMTLAMVMLVLLSSSSLVLHWGERQVKLARYRAARFAIVGTVLIGIVFLGLQTLEYREHWKTLTPTSNTYGSIFYTITSFHTAHVLIGILLLTYVSILPRYGPTIAPPYRPYHTVAIYWHFVDVVWVFIVALLYIVPNINAH